MTFAESVRADVLCIVLASQVDRTGPLDPVHIAGTVSDTSCLLLPATDHAPLTYERVRDRDNVQLVALKLIDAGYRIRPLQPHIMQVWPKG